MKKYKSFLFSEAEWQKVFNKDSESVTLASPSVTETITSEPSFNVSNNLENNEPYESFSISEDD